MASVVGTPRTPITSGHNTNAGSIMASGASSTSASNSLIGGIGSININSSTMAPATSGMPTTSSSSVFGASNLFAISVGGGSSIGANIKPVPMKLFATWEVDRTPPNCIPRLCSLTLTRLVLNKSLGPELNSVIIAVKMQSSKRTLRSNEIMLPSSGLLDTELELIFSLQYPHFLKREGNQLHVMLQRRKKYKNRTILGFKTLAVGIINMSQVLQKQMDLELELFGDVKEKTSSNAIGKVYVISLSSQPVDHEDSTEGRQKRDQDEPVERVELYSDEEDYTSAEEGSDSEPMENPLDDISSQIRRPRLSRPMKGRSSTSKMGLGSSAAARQRNIRQKFVALLKRFKVPDAEDLDQEQVDTIDLEGKLEEGSVDPAEIEDLFDELESFSDSDGPGIPGDSASIGSTPKPSLKPFFNSSRNLLHEAVITANTPGHVGSDRQSDDSSKEGVSDSHPETLTDPEFSDPPLVTSSPPQSGDEVKPTPGKEKTPGKSKLFAREKHSAFSLKQQKIGSAISSGLTGVVGYSGKENRDQVRGGPMNSGTSDYRSLVGTNYAQTDNIAPRKVLLEQLSRVLPSDGDNLVGLPDQIILANTCDRQAAHVATKLEERGGHRVVCTAGPADVRATLTCLVAKLQRFCNTKTQSPPLIKVVLIGSDIFVNSLLRTYVEVFSSKPPDWQSYLRFFIVPLGGVNTVAKYIGSQDTAYSSLFLHDSWRDILEKAEPSPNDVSELVSRVEQYLNSCGSTDNNLMHLPIAEAMVTYKERSSDEESNQVFIPFISDVRVKSDSGTGNGGPQSLDGDDNRHLPSNIASLNNPTHSPVVNATVSSSNTSGDNRECKFPDIQDKSVSRLTPPSSPHIGSSSHTFGAIGGCAASPPVSLSRERSEFNEPMDLQLDYWMMSCKDEKEGGSGVVGLSGLANIVDSSQKQDSRKSVPGSGYGDSGTKASIKTSIWRMQIQRLGVQSVSDQPTFSMQYYLKEKKSKAVMRLGKRKEKEHPELKSQDVEGITRLICLSKGQNPLKVHIDGLEWCGVKFFQLSSQWQTHIKHFPVAVFKSGI